ncbi:MAG TPA: hypothetical protein ENK20_08045 [Chromatiales bacterium]|nr:hypothetical protein [Chromatiales bacterium]
MSNDNNVLAPLMEARTWMKVLAVLAIIDGVLMVFSIWGILVAWLPIWLGVVLFQAATALDRAEGGDGGAAAQAMGKLKTFFTVAGIAAIVFLVVALLGMAGMAGMGLMLGGMGH